MSESIRLSGLSVDFDGQFQLDQVDWELAPGQQWLLLGANGAGKSALAAVLAGFGETTAGSLSGLPERVAIVSYEAQAELIAAERRKDDADIMDVISEGTPVREMIFSDGRDADLAQALVAGFGLEPLLDRAFRKLSTGETRKLMLVRALSSRPELLVLDEPFDGLDAAAQLQLAEHLQRLASETRMVLVLNRMADAPAFITDIAWLSGGQISACLKRDDEQAWAELQQLVHLKTSDIALPPLDPVDRLPPLDAEKPLVSLKSVAVKYTDTVIFENIDWEIVAGEHWQLAGPNGSGKTALLSLITGDHPQCYVNDITAFGYRRGSGESIWEIKRYIGYVSTALQWEYRVGTSLRHVIVSGFYDSIGLYEKPTEEQLRIADAWLAVLGMSERRDAPFTGLSYGDQRLLLIARAMVKHPALLILDEPCLGLDDINRQLVIALVERICAGSETTVVYVNHHAEDRIAGIERVLNLGG